MESERFDHAISQALRDRALSLPETSEGSSCVNRAFKVRKKNFLFVGEKGAEVRVMLKLVSSLDQARELAADDPRIGVGHTGWLTLRFDGGRPLDEELLFAWLEESFRGFAPKTVLKALDAD